MIYIYLALSILFLNVAIFVYKFISINKNELVLIFKKGIFFWNNPFIRQTILVSTLKFIFRLIRKTIFKV